MFGFIKKNWRGFVIGVLFAVYTSLGNRYSFHGDLASPGSLAVFIIPVFIFGLIGSAIERRIYRDKVPLPATVIGSLAFVGVCALAVYGIVVKGSERFPGGEGLLHLSRAENASIATQTCLKKFATDTQDSQDEKQKYCGCLGEVVASQMDAGKTIQHDGIEVFEEASRSCGK